MITDLSNEIPLYKNWDPKSTFSPIQPSPAEAKYSGQFIPIGAARDLSVSIPTTAKGRADCFIDDIIKVRLDRPENVERHASSAPLAVFACMRPHAGNKEPVPRREDISPAKLEVGGAPAENQIFLGWELETRILIIRLPFDKYTAYPTFTSFPQSPSLPFEEDGSNTPEPNGSPNDRRDQRRRIMDGASMAPMDANLSERL